MEDGPNKRPRLEVTGISSATRMLLDLLSYGSVSIPQAAQQLQVKETLIEKVVDVLMVVGHVTMSGGLISSTQHMLSPQALSSPASPMSSCEESYGPIPETPPQAMPMWDADSTDSDSSTPRPYATRSSTKAQKKRDPSSFSHFPPPVNHRPLLHPSLQQRSPLSYAPPPTEPARPSKEIEPVWSQSNLDSFSSLSSDKFSTKSVAHELSFESNLDLSDASIVDFFQSSFWDQY
jgi:hypothetical protein